MESREPQLASDWRERAAKLKDAVEFFGWDGDWYLRGFFDSGAPLGSHENSEARIDSIAQSWAVIAKASPARARRAMESADRILVDNSNQLVRLFTPPFDHSKPHPGYIMGYPPGLRENGGQYTHGALWMAMAWARLGEGGAAVRLLTMMNPAEHSRNLKDAAHYRAEAYVAAADVSSAEGRVGQAGWTWYTGSAGWMYRIWIEEVLGFRLRDDILTLSPVLPEEWPGFDITYRYRSSVYHIVVEKESSIEATTIAVDGGARATRDTLQVRDDGGSHRVEVRIPLKTPLPHPPAEVPARIASGGTAARAKNVLSVS